MVNKYYIALRAKVLTLKVKNFNSFNFKVKTVKVQLEITSFTVSAQLHNWQQRH